MNAGNSEGLLPIDVAETEAIKQAIRDEPRRRMDEAPGKRATEQDRHPNAATSALAQVEEDENEDEPNNKRQCSNYIGAAAAAAEEEKEEEEIKVAEEDEDSEPSDNDDDE